MKFSCCASYSFHGDLDDWAVYELTQLVLHAKNMLLEWISQAKIIACPMLSQGHRALSFP